MVSLMGPGLDATLAEDGAALLLGPMDYCTPVDPSTGWWRGCHAFQQTTRNIEEFTWYYTYTERPWLAFPVVLTCHKQDGTVTFRKVLLPALVDSRTPHGFAFSDQLFQAGIDQGFIVPRAANKGHMSVQIGGKHFVVQVTMFHGDGRNVRVADGHVAGRTKMVPCQFCIIGQELIRNLRLRMSDELFEQWEHGFRFRHLVLGEVETAYVDKELQRKYSRNHMRVRSF
mmetsp:Transcript_6832/g.12032  ORF Transcript_6832/g.12032 Transcript_6832/m.12032 type:complete len:228 (-) Transcript_6832:69-752(-)